MDFLNKPMSEVWRATKKTFNEIMEINNSDLNEATASGTQSGFSIVTPRSDESPPTVNVRASVNSSEYRYSYQSKATSLPRLQRPPQPVDFDEYHILHSADVGSSEGGGGAGEIAVGGWMAGGHTSRSRTTTPSDEDDPSNFQPRNRYRSNSSDRASTRIRSEVDAMPMDAMVNRYHR